MQAAIERKYGVKAELIESAGGVFFVDIDGKRVYNNQETYRFPTDEEIFDQIDALKT
ncbi:MAG: Rdx family protein [Candidatus Rokubacteria bacterium]|nr:Rdx family protein [Candidatus Rokubacteria bacterium]